MTAPRRFTTSVGAGRVRVAAVEQQDAAEAAYQRGSLLLKRALMMEQWGRFCRSPEFSAGTIRHPVMQAA